MKRAGKISAAELLTMKVGTSKLFVLRNRKAYDSLRSMCIYTQKTYPRVDVQRYSVKLDRTTYMATVTAIRKEALA